VEVYHDSGVNEGWAVPDIELQTGFVRLFATITGVRCFVEDRD
jgi:hypothetical protein